MAYYLHHTDSDTVLPVDIRGTSWDAIKDEFAALTAFSSSDFVALWSLEDGEVESLRGVLEALSSSARRDVVVFEGGDPAAWWSRQPEWVRTRLVDDPTGPWDKELSEALWDTTGWRAHRTSPQSEGGEKVPTLSPIGKLFVEYFTQLSPDRQNEVLRN